MLQPGVRAAFESWAHTLSNSLKTSRCYESLGFSELSRTIAVVLRDLILRSTTTFR